MIDNQTRQLVRTLLKALDRALPAMREADRAYRTLTQPQEKNRGTRKKGASHVSAR